MSLALILIACAREEAGRAVPADPVARLEADARRLLAEHEDLHQRFWNEEDPGKVDIDRMSEIDHELARVGRELLEVWKKTQPARLRTEPQDIELVEITFDAVPETIPELWERFVTLDEQEVSVSSTPEPQHRGCTPSSRSRQLSQLYEEQEPIRNALKSKYGVTTR